MSDDIGRERQGEPRDSVGRSTAGAHCPPGTAASAAAGRAIVCESAVEPLSHDELRRSLVRPDLLAAHVLGSVDRVARNLTDGAGLWLLALLLADASLLATVPYGTFSPDGSPWKPAVLFTGSLLVCVPCLHVFLQFLGFKVSLVRSLSLSLVITATAALFTLGFFPIIWFIDLTTRAGDDSSVTPAGLSRFLLAISLLMGVIQMIRCLAASRFGVRKGGGMTTTILLWLALLVFIVWRMARVLGLRG